MKTAIIIITILTILVLNLLNEYRLTTKLNEANTELLYYKALFEKFHKENKQLKQKLSNKQL